MRVGNRKYDVASCFLALPFFLFQWKKLDILVVVQVVLFDTFNRSISEYLSSETLNEETFSEFQF